MIEHYSAMFKQLFSWPMCVLITLSLLFSYVVFFSSLDFLKIPEPNEAESFQKLTHIERAVSDVLTPSAVDESQWRRVSLPDNWANQNLNAKHVWYRASFSTPTQRHKKLALFVPTIKQNLEAYLNNNWLGESGPFKPRLSHSWNHPQLFQFSDELLIDQNTLYLRVASNRVGNGFISSIYLGEAGVLETYWRWTHFFKVTFLELSSAFLFVIGLINFYLWTLRKQDTFYLWYALAAICWGTRGLLLVIPVLPLSEELRVTLRMLTLGYGVVFVVLFNFRYFGYRNRFFDWAILLYCLPAALPMLFMDLETLSFYGHQIWVKGNLILGVIVSVFLTRLYLVKRNFDALALLYSGIPLLILGFRDMLLLTDQWEPNYGFLINHATLPALTIAMWFILRRLSETLNYSEQLNVSLETRIQDREKAIQISFMEREKLQNRQLLSDERERIMRDMHDGLGAHLVGLKSLMEANKPSLRNVRRYVDLAMVDLRLVINSLDTTSQNLSSLLGTMRGRWQILAQSKSRTLRWKVERVTTQHQFGPSKTLELMRILEEGFTNALKHGSASDIEVSCGDDPAFNTFWIAISNGVETESVAASNKYGLKNMNARARKIDAIIETSVSNGIFKLHVSLKHVLK